MRLTRPKFPIVDLAVQGADQEVVQSLIRYSLVVVRTPEVTAEDTRPLTEMIQRYASQPSSVLICDVRPDDGRQIGLTEPNIENFNTTGYFRRMPSVEALVGDRAPFAHQGGNRHMRFFARYGPRPKSTRFPERHAEPVIPNGFPEWAAVMNGWGDKIFTVGMRLAELIERGLGLSHGAIVGLLHEGPHLVSPTICDLADLPYGAVISDIHTDFNPFTGHGSAFPTLISWTPDGRPFVVRVPAGCLLFQAGAQLEWVTGGKIRAGLHQTAMTHEAVRLMKAIKLMGQSTIRVSSTFFFEANVDKILQVDPHLSYPGAHDRYPPILVGEHSSQVIQAIGLNSPPAAPW